MPTRKNRNSHGRRASLTLSLAGALFLLTAAPGSAAADPDPGPAGQLDQRVHEAVEQLRDPKPKDSSSEQSAAAPLPTREDDDSPGHETPDPTRPDHGASQGLEAGVAGNQLLGAGSSYSEIENNHSSSADATALAIGGQEVIGSHADSDGQRHDEDGDPLAPICDESGGALCATLLYSEASATETNTTSHSASRSGAASACVGGADPTGESCNGPVGAGVLQGWSEIHRGPSGHTHAESGSSVADICIGEINPLTGACSVGVEAVTSEGRSDSRGTAEKESQVLALELAGVQQGSFEDPVAIAIPPNCTTPSVLCVFMNQGETYLGNGIAGHAVEALHVSLLDDTVLAHAAQSETLVHKAGSRSNPPKCPKAKNCPRPPDCPGDRDCPNDGPKCVGGNCPTGGPGDNAGPGGPLPDTGGFWIGLVPIGLLAVAMGVYLVARGRRRELIDGSA